MKLEKGSLEPITTKKDYDNLTNEEKAMIAINSCKNVFKAESEFKILKLGNIISGYAYYHELDDYYQLIGMQIKYRYKYLRRDEPVEQVGFFPIYVGKISENHPTAFEDPVGYREFDEHKYENGLGDYIEVDGILISIDKLDKVVF